MKTHERVETRVWASFRNVSSGSLHSVLAVALASLLGAQAASGAIIYDNGLPCLCVSPGSDFSLDPSGFVSLQSARGYPKRVARKSLSESRGRDAGCPAPPAQIPAGGFPAPGSSNQLALACAAGLLLGNRNPRIR